MKERSGTRALCPPAQADFCHHPASRRIQRYWSYWMCGQCCRFISGPIDVLIPASLPGPEQARLRRWYGME